MPKHLSLNPSNLSQRRQYTCQDCKHKNYLMRVEFTRRAKPRCRRCGCTRLDESSVARLENAVRNDVVKGRSGFVAGNAKAAPELSNAAMAWVETHPYGARTLRCCHAGDPIGLIDAIEVAAEHNTPEPAFAVDDAVRFRGRKTISFIKKVRFDRRTGCWEYTDTDGNTGVGLADFSHR